MAIRSTSPKRKVFSILILSLLYNLAPAPALAQETPVDKQTFIYKKVDNLELKADVYTAKGDGPRPIVLWVHGGALIMGDRGGADRVLRQKLPQAGYVFVSVDYRLAPETKLAAILEDLDSAYAWVRTEGPKLFNADPTRLAVMGGSAGGYLSLVAGYREKPAPRAIVSFWGYGDIAGDWYTKPDAFYSRQPAVPKAEAYASVGKAPVSEPARGNKRGQFYLYCRQHGLWTTEVSGHDPQKEPKIVETFCPIRNVSASYPPTMLIHGTKDTDVPYAQSAAMDQELTKRGVEHEFITIRDMGHGFGGTDSAVINNAHERVLAFLKEYMK